MKQLNKLDIAKAEAISYDLQRYADLSLSSKKLLIHGLALLNGLPELSAAVLEETPDEAALRLLVAEQEDLLDELYKRKGQ